MEQKDFEHTAIVITMKHKLQNGIQEIVRDYGKDLKRKGIDAKEFSLFLLDATSEALKELQEEAQEEKQK